jgi:hypothetical protein
MSINNSHYGQNGVLLYNGEVILIYYDGVELALDPYNPVALMKGKKKGRIYLTSHRIVFINKDQNDVFQSFSMPFMCMRSLEIEQPVFGANYIKGEVRNEPYGKWDGTAKFKLWFNNGGAIEFGQCLLNAGKLASQARAAQQTVQTHVNQGDIYPAPPPAYTNLNSNTYGWVPMDRFPDRPQGENVYMYDQPPPYAGIYDQKDQKTNTFDIRQRVATGYVNPDDPSKVYVPTAPQEEELPPSYSDSQNKKNA